MNIRIIPPKFNLNKDYVVSVNWAKHRKCLRNQSPGIQATPDESTSFGSELGKLEAGIGDDIDVDVADMKKVAHALIGSKDTDRFPIVTPR